MSMRVLGRSLGRMAGEANQINFTDREATGMIRIAYEVMINAAQN